MVAKRCYVLEDGSRVLTRSGLISSLDMGSGDDRLVSFSGGKSISPFISKDLADAINNPIRFHTPRGGPPAYGYPESIAVKAYKMAEAMLAQREVVGNE